MICEVWSCLASVARDMSRYCAWVSMRTESRQRMFCLPDKKRTSCSLALGTGGLLILLFSFVVSAHADCGWTNLQPGLDLAECDCGPGGAVLQAPILVLRIDPNQWQLRLLCADRDTNGQNRTALEWCRAESLVAAINAGMFATDYQTHVGYLKSGSHVQNSNINNYQSLLAFDAVALDSPSARVFDLDVSSLDSLRGRYGSLVQNLRLIKRPGLNRWSQQNRKWSEAALGEDSDGNILFIFSRTPFSMFDFNKILLSLPIDLVCAQHLEGGPEAQFCIDLPGCERERVGSFETGFWEKHTNKRAHRIPNVIGVIPRARPAESATGD